MRKLWVAVILLNILLLLAIGCSNEKSEKEYYDLAYQYMGKEKWSEAEKNFQMILDKYPNGTYSSKALFMVGFINANHLNNYEKAEKYYKDFLEKYPNHDLADDAKYEIDNLGKSIDDLPFLKDESVDQDTVQEEKSQKVTVSTE